jgi:hypothetical protein
MVKMAYVPNMIRIPTHGVDWCHHGLRVGERKLKSLMEPPQGEERKRKKKNRGGRKKKRGGGTVGGPITPVYSM